jgi:hypothetical protein
MDVGRKLHGHRTEIARTLDERWTKVEQMSNKSRTNVKWTKQ